MLSGASPQQKITKAGRAECYKVQGEPQKQQLLQPCQLQPGQTALKHALTPLSCAPPPRRQARDAFYQCMRESGVLYNSKTPIPGRCTQLRVLFESACLASWVRARWQTLHAAAAHCPPHPHPATAH